MSSHAHYDSIQMAQNNTPYGAGDPYYHESSGYLTTSPPKPKSNRKWFIIGVAAVCVIVAAVVGGVVGSRNKNSSVSAAAAAASSSSLSASAAVSAKEDVGLFATATDSLYMIPIYPSTTNTAAFTVPTFVDTTDSKTSWPTDSFQPSDPAPTSLRPDRPRLIAPQYKWDALPTLIANDAYMTSWNDTIWGNATAMYAKACTTYFLDDTNGILDVAREVKSRIKHWGYAYKLTNDTKWADRIWMEIQCTAGNGTDAAAADWPTDLGDQLWNPDHFLDTAEFSVAYAIAYDWLYDVWTDDQKESIRYTLVELGLNQGLNGLTNSSNYNDWWATNTTGNWNCVCNNGLIMGSLAIYGDDTTDVASQLLSTTIDDALENCALATTSDGTWSETPDYWYFGSTGFAELVSSLQTATGSDFKMLTTNTGMADSGKFHMYVSGATSMFAFGDTGPNKYTATANPLHFYATAYSQPQYSLFQRDQADAAEPWSMFWYDPTVTGAFWDGLQLDGFFDNELDQWSSMRSSWTDQNALYVGMKAGMNQGRQTHNDLDVGDFVIDALGQRWGGELGDGDYNAPYYFSNDSQTSARWYYYRKATEGQNTILINQGNQDVLAQPTIKYDSTGDVQGSSTVFSPNDTSAAYFTTDMTSAYFNATSVKRGIRPINKRTQVLLQDEITTSDPFMWRMHTNATVTLSTDNSTATLTLGGQTMIVTIINNSAGATFSTMEAVRFATDPIPPEADQPNDGVTVLTIQLDAGTYTLEVLFNPQWSGMSSSDYLTPSSVALDSWSLTSHLSS